MKSEKQHNGDDSNEYIMTFFKKPIHRSRHIVFYGAILALLVFALKWMQWKFLIRDYSLEIYSGLIAAIFTILGIWIAKQLTKSKTRTVVVEKEIYIPPQDDAVINETEPNLLKQSMEKRTCLNIPFSL